MLCCAQVLNPPLVGVIAGVLIGVSPLGQLLYRPDNPAVAAYTLRLPMELRVCLGKPSFLPLALAVAFKE